MQLIDNLFKVKSTTKLADGGFLVGLEPQCSHPVYKAHFPNHPVTPGVCLVQMAHELAARCLSLPLCLKSIKNVKFLNIVIPQSSFTVFYELHYDSASSQLRVVVKGEKVVYSKMTLMLQ